MSHPSPPAPRRILIPSRGPLARGRHVLGAAVVLLVGISGCAAPDAPHERLAEGVSPISPSVVPTYIGTPTDKPMSESLEKPLAANETDTTKQCNHCKLSNGLDVVSPKDVSLGSYTPPTYHTSGDASDPLKLAYDDVKAKAQATLDKASANNAQDTLDVIEDLFGLLPGAEVQKTSFTKTPWVKEWSPVHGRQMLRSFGTDYPRSKVLNELGDRGARSYCGMREAAKAQAASPGGKRMHSSVGAHAVFWDFFSTKGDVTLLPTDPSYRSTSHPGAQAFVVPMAIGAQVAPMKGPLIPDFGTFQHPLVWVSGDTEANTLENRVLSSYTRTYRNMSHFDVFGGVQHTGGRVEFSNLTLANFGLFQLGMHGAVDVTIGRLDSLDGPTELTSGKGFYNSFHTGYAGWPTARGNGLGSGDSPLGLNLNCSDEFGYEHPFASVLGGCYMSPYDVTSDDALPGWSTNAGWGTAARWRNDDDRSFAVTDEVKLSVGADLGVGFDFGILQLKVIASMTIDATSRMSVVVREQLSEVDRDDLSPVGAPSTDKVLQSNLVMTPAPENVVDIHPLTVGLDIKVPLPWPIGTIAWNEDIFSLGKVEAASDKPATTESDRLRVGEFSEVAPVGLGFGKMPLVSHLPGGTSFAAIPTSLTTCLADPTSVGSEPTSTPSTPGDPEKHLNVCHVGLDVHGIQHYANALNAVATYYSSTGVPVGTLPPLGADICSDPTKKAAFAAQFFDSAQRACIDASLSYLCGPSSAIVTYENQTMISHVMDPTKSAETDALLKQCTGAFVNVEDPVIANAFGQMFVNDFMHMHVCDDVGNLAGDAPEPCDNPDATTGGCWSLNPCYLDPNSGLCESTCPDGNTTSCSPIVLTCEDIGTC